MYSYIENQFNINNKLLLVRKCSYNEGVFANDDIKINSFLTSDSFINSKINDECFTLTKENILNNDNLTLNDLINFQNRYYQLSYQNVFIFFINNKVCVASLTEIKKDDQLFKLYGIGHWLVCLNDNYKNNIHNINIIKEYIKLTLSGNNKKVIQDIMIYKDLLL